MVPCEARTYFKYLSQSVFEKLRKYRGIVELHFSSGYLAYSVTALMKLKFRVFHTTARQRTGEVYMGFDLMLKVGGGAICGRMNWWHFYLSGVLPSVVVQKNVGLCRPPR